MRTRTAGGDELDAGRRSREGQCEGETTQVHESPLSIFGHIRTPLSTVAGNRCGWD